jgi:hypothetical protein
LAENEREQMRAIENERARQMGGRSGIQGEQAGRRGTHASEHKATW